jgi:hypothetical protein
MTMTASAFVTRACLFVSVFAFTAAGCSNSSPTAPTPTASGPTPVASAPAPAPTSPPPPAPTPTGAVTITINPNPVAHSGAPITDAAGCANVKYTWYYDQVLQETGGSAVTFTGRIDLFDERETNNRNDLNIVVSASGSTTIRSRWCSSAKGRHTAQTQFRGTDAAGRSVIVMGPKVNLVEPQ